MKYLSTNIGRQASSVDFGLITVEICEKINASLLAAFYKCRVVKDLKEKIVLPIKGTAKKVHNNELDQKTKGPFLIQKCVNVRMLPVIAEPPKFEQIEIVPDDVPPLQLLP